MKLLSQDDLRARITGCWLGKNIGGTLGAPYEGYVAVHNLTFYDPVPTEAVPNDDLELQAMYAAALVRRDKAEVNRRTLGEIWLKHMDFHPDEYGVAIRNLRMGILPPWSGEYENYYSDGMGAAIRSELWACLAPGDPERAAAYAREDACIDHAGIGIEAEVFLAALESLAFVESDLDLLIDRALRFLPDDSRLRESLATTRTLWNRTADWLTVRNALMERYATEFKCCVLPNVPFAILGLLAGDGDFSRTICIAANCGMDTDCTAATAGAVRGIIRPDSIPAEWLAPIGRQLAIRPTAIRGLACAATIDELTGQVIELAGKITAGTAAPQSSPPNLEACGIDAEYAFLQNFAWYRIEAKQVEWHAFRCRQLLGSLALPAGHGYGFQALLRFRFRIATAGSYSIMFNSVSSNQVYLDPDWTLGYLHDSRHMLFGRQRQWDNETSSGRFPVSERPVIFSPCLGGAPLNQIKRNVFLEPGTHELVAAVEPFTADSEISWGMGIGGPDHAFLPLGSH